MHPSDYGTAVQRPADFDRFWAQALAEAEAVPLNGRVERSEYWSTAEVQVYRVSFNSLGEVRVGGWYVTPSGPGPFPAQIFTPGYISDPAIHFGWAREGYATLMLAHRGKLGSTSQWNPGYPGVLTHNITDKNTYSYRGIYMDAVRGFDLLLTLPKVRPDRVAAQGSSQGGALTTVVCAFRGERIIAAVAGAPYLTGFMEAIRLTRSYPYEEINEYLRHYPARVDQVRDTLAYFDCHNLAPMVKCPILVNIGMQDDICPPETGFEYFRRLGSDQKELKVYDPAGHDAGRHVNDALIRAHLARYLKA
ncbi:MAG TPA: acetylxylan esterase [Symbiobacteriaceae bacterium]|nr:acetylxylan esterase [Symbiobacteriaceae bacterium]